MRCTYKVLNYFESMGKNCLYYLSMQEIVLKHCILLRKEMSFEISVIVSIWQDVKAGWCTNFLT